ncbi:MAG: type II toxin-antitoxin system RelB/DinJ family antitoxin [Candidatus Peregrinibacteria bacterium]
MTTITLKIENDLKRKAQKLVDELGFSLSAVIKAFLKNMVRTEKIDFGLKPRYHTTPEPGDLVMSMDDSVEYFKKLANEDGNMEKDI